MSTSTVLSRTRGSTADVPPQDRIAYWEDLIGTTLVGLRCSSLSPGGLEVEATSIAVPGLVVADIRGCDHLVERGPMQVQRLPKESLFASQVVSGRAYFIQRDQCVLAQAGDWIVYDTRIPYVFGFLTSTRQLLVDIPFTTLDRQLDAELTALPLKISPRPGAGGMLGETLCKSVERFMRDPADHDTMGFSEYARMLVAELVMGEVHGANASRATLSYLLTAKRYIATRLGDPELAPQSVADAVGLSQRHLSRLFAMEGVSITQYIWSERLTHAYRELTDPRLFKTSVGEIAFRWGFSSQAHFSRAIRERYGMSPLMLRDARRS
ncbi:helix-turn-helix domain-containing protein [Oxalobacteraceae bacterium A2-2]